MGMGTARLSDDACSIDDFVELVEQGAASTTIDQYRFAERIDHGAVVYSAATLRALPDDPSTHRDVLDELSRVFLSGPGIVVIAGAVDAEVVDAASEQFFDIIESERTAGGPSGDHFAPAGANDRVWNALQKLAERSPEVFVDYYANDMLATVCEAWLGPGYQITSQINVVNPGGQAQSPHRDYHLGFMSVDEAARYPAHVHRLSPLMTLQGAIAHCDMPIETGPTMYLPHSQKYELGYLAWWLDDFKEYFADHHVQVPLSSGDAVFFNPALFHGAGTNRTSDVRRIANLLQVGTTMGRTLEAVDRRAMVRHLYPVWLERLGAGADRTAIDRSVAASAEAYYAPLDLDRSQPVDGLHPPGDADLVRTALDERWPIDRLLDRLGDTATVR
ncbi:MAG: phytanoyl-CoA dioxygenase family protein [Actinomycetota bacterium]